MSKAEKLAARILSGRSDKNFAFDDLCHVWSEPAFNCGQEKEATGFTTKMESWKSSTSSRGMGKRSHIK